MLKEYQTVTSIAGPLMLVEMVDEAKYGHIVDIELGDTVELGEPDHASEPQPDSEGAALYLRRDGVTATGQAAHPERDGNAEDVRALRLQANIGEGDAVVRAGVEPGVVEHLVGVECRRLLGTRGPWRHRGEDRGQRQTDGGATRTRPAECENRDYYGQEDYPCQSCLAGETTDVLLTKNFAPPASSHQ